MPILAIEGSTRDDSATLIALNKYVKERNEDAAKIVRLKHAELPQFVDDRTGRNWRTSPKLEELLEDLVRAGEVILASPLYWYSVSNIMKNYLDHWTYYLRHDKHPLKDACKGKPFSFLIVGSSEDATLADPVFASLRQSVHYVGGKVNDERYISEAAARR